MKVLIVYKSMHRMNTGKIAEAMAEATGARLAGPGDVPPDELAGYDLIGFGSGIYQDQYHNDVMRLIGEMPAMDKPVFIFHTAAVLKDNYNAHIRSKLAEKCCRVVGEFACPGEFVPLGINLGRALPGHLVLISGKNHHRPDERDLDNARSFARNLVNEIQRMNKAGQWISARHESVLRARDRSEGCSY